MEKLIFLLCSISLSIHSILCWSYTSVAAKGLQRHYVVLSPVLPQVVLPHRQIIITVATHHGSCVCCTLCAVAVMAIGDKEAKLTDMWMMLSTHPMYFYARYGVYDVFKKYS